MDSQRFEELTRGLATARSRRDIVKVLIGGLFAGGSVVAAERSGALAQSPCSDDTGCADDEICCAGTCRAIECCIDEANPNARCPEGTSCFEGICTPIEEPGACAGDAECAEDEICCAGTCRAIECCIDEANPNARCPEGTSCFEGVCDPVAANSGDTDGGAQAPVVKLPSTGVGPPSSSNRSVMSTILASSAAVAAALGARTLRRQPANTEDAPH